MASRFTRFKNRILGKSKQVLIDHILKKYKKSASHADGTTHAYTKGLIAMILESKTFNTLFVAHLKHIVYQTIQQDLKNVDALQADLLNIILQKTQETLFGKYYQFAHILEKRHTYDEFVKKVPITDYEEMKSWIERAKHEEDVIWPGKITKFSASAGTTSRKKHIPISDECLDSMGKAGLDMFATYVTKYPDTEIFSGYFWPLIGTIQEQLDDGSIISDVSALLTLERNSMLQKKYKFPLEVLLESDRYIKREHCCSMMDPEEKTVILGVTSWINEIFSYIEKKDAKKFQQFIKNLQLIIRGGVSAKPYINYFNSLGVPHIGVYNASEGYFGYQDVVNYANDTAQAPYQLVINHGVFYELIPFTAENFDNGILQADAKVIPLWKLSERDIKNKNKFALVITNNSGLFRYMIGDVIQFVDTSYRFHIIGRTKQCINLKGEELMEDQINTVIQKINHEFSVSIQQYTVGPDKDNDPTCHARVIEGLGLDSVDQKSMVKTIDLYLQQSNADYEAKRKHDILLKIPIINIVPQGTFHIWLESHNKLGGQNKVPKLSSERKIIDELLSA